jgi:uncharacterized protein (TIGR02231 family)
MYNFKNMFVSPSALERAGAKTTVGPSAMDVIRSLSMKMELILLCCCLWFGVALAKEWDSKITDVTVYGNMAMIQRSVTLNLQAGENRLAIGHLPATLIDESMHIRLSNEAQVSIQDVKVERWFLEKAEELVSKKIEEQLNALDREDKNLDNEIKALKSQEKFLASIQVAADTKSSQELLAGKMDAATWTSTLTFLKKNLNEVYDQMTDVELKKKELEGKREVLKKQLQQVQSARPKEEKAVELILQARSPLSVEVVLSYLMHDVSWSPTYELRGLPQEDKVELVYSAEVRQKSGEDWQGVNLVLSTATPALGAQAPELQPWYIYLHKLQPARMMKGAMEQQMQLMRDATVAAAPAAEAPPPPSVVETKGASAIFAISGKRDVPSSEEATKVLVQRHIFPAQMSYLTIPKLSAHAYLKAVFENNSEYPLIAGSAMTYVDGDYVGKSALENKSVGEKLELSLGVDANIKIKYELIKRFERNKGMLSKKTELEYVYKVTCENYRNKPTTLQILDQVPISRNEDVEVSDVKLQPEPAEWNKENGKLTWNIELKPKEKRELTIGFLVSYPRDGIINGLF